MGNRNASSATPTTTGENVQPTRSNDQDDVEKREKHCRAQNQVIRARSSNDASKDLHIMGFEFRAVEPIEQSGSLSESQLFHVESDQLITSQNRKLYIPDGAMFDAVTNLCQEIVQGKLIKEWKLKWVTVCTDSAQGGEPPICAMVDADDQETWGDDEKCSHHQPTLLIIPGKGTSRAGILSTKELLNSGMEKGSALFHVKQARCRGMKLVLVDPNARGVQAGMDTFERSMNALVCPDNVTGPIHVLAHSAGGGFLVRYLLKHKALIPHIGAVAFTDSTHNIQWAKDEPRLFDLLQSKKCLYIRSNGGRVRAFDMYSDHTNAKAGDLANGDQFWRHRFGNVTTIWAGTTEHSLMCWTARNQIWDHFDENASWPCQS